MLDWMKDKIGRKQSPLQALQAGAFKDEAEKQGLLEALANTEGLKAEDILPLLSHADAGVQQRASSLFLSRASIGGVMALLDAVIGADATLRPLLSKTLMRAKAEHVKPALEMILKDAKQDRLRTAWEVSMEFPEEISEAYVGRAFKEGPPKARYDALRRMMAKKQPAELRPTLIEALDDRENRVRKLAVDALVKLEGNDIFEAMLDRIVADDNVEIRKAAGGYLQKYIATAPRDLRPAILGRLLLTGDVGLQTQLVTELFASGDHGELLLEILTFAKTVLGVQHATILDSMKPLGEGLVEHAIRLLDHDDPDLRIQAVLLLERFASPKTAAAVLRLLGDSDWWVRIMACDTLGRLKDPRTLPQLERMLDDQDCKWAAIDSIGTIGGESAIGTLVKLLGDPQNEVRLVAMNALGKIADPRVDGYIEQLSRTDASLDLRVRAVELLRERRGVAGGAEAAILSSQLTRPMERLFAFARESQASDLHVSPDEPPFLRINGVLQRVEMKPLSAGQVESLVNEILDPVRRPILDSKGAVDFCYSIPGVGRYRVNVFRQVRGTGAAVRIIPNVTPTLASLGLPKHLEEVGTYHQGIILMTGPAGAGKSTTLTAIVNVLNESRNAHVLSLEDPIEFLHTPKKALINQREIGRDSQSFAAAMRGALREDPDVIIVGELRDKETMRLAMVAAETGHLVIATMQTTGATATIDKLIESFPSDEQHQIRIQLAGSLKLIVSQILVPRADGRARVAVFEILKSTSSVRATIRDGKTFQLGSAMQIGRSHGMLTLDASLEQLLADGAITFETAYAYAQKKELFTKGKTAREGGRASIPAPAAEGGERPSIPTDISTVAETGPRAALASVRPPPPPEVAPAPQARAQPMPAQPRAPFSDRPPSTHPAARPPQPPAAARPAVAPAQPAPAARPPMAPPQVQPPPAARPPMGPPQPQPRPAVAQPAPAPAAQPAPAAATPRKRISIPRDD
jgi:twitching motility protein PilT